MDTKGANPFLMMGGDDYTSPPVNSNPFLMEEFSNETTFCDNPFLAQTEPAPLDAAPVNNATNPFAFDPMDYGPPQPAVETHQSPQTNDIFSNNLISQPKPAEEISTTDFFSINNTEPTINSLPVQKPDALNLKHTNTVTKVEDNIQLYSSDEELTKAPPRRPPPPRPNVPPATKDLIMSVTGAMDATSSHLLDRIPPTRTPSPVSMRDLHSPSPTPEHAFTDFLDVGNPKPATNAVVDLFDLNEPKDNKASVQEPVISSSNTDTLVSFMSNDPVCDINQNHSIKQPSVQPMVQPSVQPSMQPPEQPPMQPPVRPPRPLPPVKPPPPAVKPLEVKSMPKPPVPPHPAQKNVDMMDMLGDSDLPPPETKVEKTQASTADIMSLYSTPPAAAKPEPIMDLLCESNEVDIVPTQETIVSPELSQQDMHMDTSDTQSKGSASSVTFNPFSAEETAISTIVDTTSPVPVKTENLSQDIFSQPENEQTIMNTDIFADQPNVEPTPNDIFSTQPEVTNIITNEFEQNDSLFNQTTDEFDDFAAKFESAAKDDSKNGFDPFGGNNNSAWGNIDDDNKEFASGFDADEPFDAFLSLQEPPAVPQHTPSILSKRESQESDEDKDFSVFIKPKTEDDSLRSDVAMPVLAPPPKSPIQNAFNDTSPRFNPFDQQTEFVSAVVDQTGPVPVGGQFQRTDSQETPPTPLFDEDVSQPLEDFPRIYWAEEGWELQLRQPNKKKITGQRFWKKIFVKLIMHEDCPILQLFNANTDKDPFQELPLQPCYSVSEIGAQQYDNYGKIFTVKLQYIFYKERPGVRPGQVTKAERITNKLSQFAAYAIQGDYQGVKEFGSDLKKLGLPVEHAPQVSQLLKLGSLNYEDMKQFSVTIEEALFHLLAHRDRALHYKMEEVQITAVDELYVEQSADGCVEKQIARVRLFFLGFLSGMPDVELGINDMRRQGKEVVGRHDIIPVITEEWIRLEAVEFHSCVQQDEYHNTHIIKFKPPDACYIELMRFRIRPPKNRELPLQLKPVICVTGNKVEIKADCLVPGFASRKLGQVPCEDVMIRIPIPECWIYLFRVEKHFRYGSVKSSHRRTGKIKGIERILGTMETLQESLIEVTSGQAKYEHQHRAIVWRIPRLPKEGQGAYTTHNLVCRLALTSYDQVPEQLAEFCYVEFTMPATQVSHMTVRSVSLQNSQSDDPPEKYVRYLARHEYKVGIEHTEGQDPNAYAAATMVSRTPAPVAEEPTPPPAAESSSDSD